MTTDLPTRIAELTAQIEAWLAEDEATANAATEASGQWFEPDPGAGDWTVRNNKAIVESPAGIIVFDEGCPTGEQATHIARNDPARILRRVKATRSLVAAILARPHVLDDSEWYGCQAVTHSYSAADGSRFPEPEGRRVPSGRECTCGRDEDVAKLLGIIASEWEA